jgi:ureidoacrylate peracid hydrolase
MLTTLEERVHPDRAALLVIDMQNDYCDPEGGFARTAEEPEHIRDMVPRLQKLLKVARQTGVPVIFVRTHQTPQTGSPAWLSRYRDKPNTYFCQPGTWGAQFYGVRPTAHETIVTKHRYSGFIGTDLDLVLRSQGIRTIITTGVSTNACVESTARDGFMMDYYVVMVSDCCGCSSIEEHEASLKVISKFFGIVASSEEVISSWQKQKAAADS